MKPVPPLEDRPPETPVPGVLDVDQFNQIFDKSMVIVGVKDLEGRYVHVNKPFADLLGGKVEDFRGKTDRDLFTEELSRRLRANDAEVMKLGAGRVFEEQIEIDRQQRIFHTRKFPLLGADGSPVGICLMASDITAERRTERALERIALSVSSATGPEVFDLIVSNLADALGVEFAFIAQITEREPETLQALSAWYRGEHVTPPCYTSAGTPCADVLGNGFTYISGDLQRTHPGDGMLLEFDFRSYAGFPLTDVDGRRSGVLSICHSGALPDAGLVEHLLQIFSVRASAELERAATEAALRASEASYRTMFEFAEDPILVHDINTGAIVDVNHKACEAFGYSREEMLGLGCGELSSGIPPYTAEAASELLQKAAKDEPQRIEWQRRNKDGSLHWDEVTLNRVALSGVDRVLAVSRDVTERRRREADLRRSENRLRATIEVALDAIVIMDSAGRIVACNPAAEACFGWTADEMRGREMAATIIPDRHREAHRAGLERYLRSGRSTMIGRRTEITALRRDGTEFPVELAVAVTPDHAGNTFVGYLRDISERLESEQRRAQLETQLRQAQKMEAIGHLAGGIAHDFNNILTGTVGYLGLARDAVTGGDADPVRLDRYLAQATESAARATELVRQLLTFSRGRAGNPEALDLGRVVRHCATLLHSTIPSSTELEFQLADTVPPVFLDPVQAEQVLLNLCINARDAMDGKGRIVIRVRAQAVEGKTCCACREPFSGEFVQLSVEDSGRGIDDGLVDRIFEPFFSTKPTGHGSGSGMGLAIVHGIVHEQGGHIEVVSHAGRGTIFNVLLPAHRARRSRAEQKPPEPARGARRLRGCVLIVDDEPSVGRFMVDQLEAFGLDAVHRSSAAEALELLAGGERRPDAVVVDYTMPGMNGLEFVEELRNRHPRLPALLYSGYLEQVPADELARLQLPAPLEKPLKTAALFDALESLLST